MRLLDALGYGFKALGERRLRSILTILGIAIGSALIIALAANGQGLNVSITQSLLDLGANNVVILPSGDSGISFTDADIQRISVIAGVDKVLPFYMTAAKIRVGGAELDGRVMATDPAFITILFPKLEIQEGRAPGRSDLSLVGIGHDIAFPHEYTGLSVLPGHPLVVEVSQGGKKVEKAFIVSALYKKFGASLFVDVDKMVLMSIPAGRSLLGLNNYQGILVRVGETELVDHVVSALENIYGRSVTIISPTSMVRTIQQLINSFTFFLLVVAAISLFVAGIGIANTMVMSVMERVREIGILRAMGMTKRGILLVFMSEALLTGMIGGALGIAIGVALSMGMGNIFSSFLRGGPRMQMPLPYEPLITPDLLIGTFFFALLVGAVSGLYPARRAAALDPVQALRTE